MSTEDLQQNNADSAAEEAAFESSFHETRQEEAPPELLDDPAPAAVAEEPAAKDASPAAAEDVPPAATPVVAGLTEEQVANALARISQQQGTIDKLGGRIGQLMQQVEQLKSQPRTAAEQRSFDLKLEKLNEAFPELAEILREDLKGLTGGGVPAPTEPQAKTYTAEEVEALLNNKLQSFQQQQERAFEVKALGAVHPDWEQLVRTPQFALWRDNVIADGKELMESENAAFISRKLTEFKDWVKATSSPAHVEPAPAARQPNPVQAAQQRLRQAVLPSSSAPPASQAVTEDDGFAAGFAAERGKRGY
jgi:hypothetical protein